MMGEAFSRTLATAQEADGIAALLRRTSNTARTRQDGQRLELLAQRYADYAQALRETVTPATREPDPAEQPLL